MLSTSNQPKKKIRRNHQGQSQPGQRTSKLHGADNAELRACTAQAMQRPAHVQSQARSMVWQGRTPCADHGHLENAPTRQNACWRRGKMKHDAVCAACNALMGPIEPGHNETGGTPTANTSVKACRTAPSLNPNNPHIKEPRKSKRRALLFHGLLESCTASRARGAPGAGGSIVPL